MLLCVSLISVRTLARRKTFSMSRKTILDVSAILYDYDVTDDVTQSLPGHVIPYQTTNDVDDVMF